MDHSMVVPRLPSSSIYRAKRHRWLQLLTDIKWRNREGPEPALAASAIGSFFAGTVATFLIAAFGPPLAAAALKFGPAEFFSLMVLGLVASVVLAQGSLLHAIGMVVLGLLLGLIGTDVNSGTQRFTFGIFDLADGIGFVTVAMGMFGLGEIIRNLQDEEERSVVVTKITGLWPTKEDFKRMVAPILRGTVIGSALGILPGSGSILGSFAAYSIEKKISKNRAQFGKGAIEGVAAPEAANNAGAQTSFIPLLTLGIPSNPVSALMVGAMIVHGIQPGPSVITEQPALFWGMIVSMWIGNLFLVILNYPLIGMWVRMIMIPYQFLYPGILVFCAIGVFSLKNTEFDIYFMALFGALGYVFSKLGGEPAPMLLAFILGPLMEEYLRRAMLLSRGNPWVFVQRPISATLLALAVARHVLGIDSGVQQDAGRSVCRRCELILQIVSSGNATADGQVSFRDSLNHSLRDKGVKII